MHKNGKWAKQIVSLQESDGKWGWFHSLSQFYNSPITTEQALRRLERLGYTIEDECIQKAVDYMNDCLIGKNSIPDRKEKLHNWDIFTSLILATWIRRFTCDNSNANKVAKQWSEIVSAAFINGTYNHEMYISVYTDIFKQKPNGGRILDFVSFYQISLISDCLDENTEKAVIDYVIDKDNGIYYIYEDKIAVLPQTFESKEASRYIAAIELLSEYKYSKYKLNYVTDWLNNNRNENGKWDMGKVVNDKIYFPLSDDWRKQKTRENDCSERIANLIEHLQ
ncbi:MAG: hypothetical protein NC489_33610 [Ruminococcus flavefaciens]|nr:hypothetical protein [Ruminococcus flavefaciens]